MAPVIKAIKEKAIGIGRAIDEDHFGAGFSFRFGSSKDPIIARYQKVVTQRIGHDPSKYTAVGGVTEIMALLHEFRQAGVHKFVLRPIASGTEDMLEQTRQLVEKVLPRVSALN